MRKIFSIFIFFNLVLAELHADSFTYNTFNNHGVIGLINMPTARFYDEASFGITAYNGTPDQKITFTSFPYDWMEASFFYTNIQGKPYCDQILNPICQQDSKDKGFNFRFRLKEEGNLPAIAVGFNDIAGTGLYSSEYVVASYGIKNTDFHFGLGWGLLNGAKESYKNPLGYIYDGFYTRPNNFEDQGGQFQPSRYFSDKTVSPFYGISHAINERLILKLERDTIKTPGLIGYDQAKKKYSLGFDYSLNSNFSIGASYERGNYASIKFLYKVNPKSSKKKYTYTKANTKKHDSKYVKLVKHIENNGIGVNKIVELDDSIGLELTQFTHPNLEVIEEIVKFSAYDAGIDENIETNLKIANLTALEEFNSNDGLNIYTKNKKPGINTNTFLNFRPYLAAREGFFKGALLLENNSEYIFSDSFFFSSNLKYSIIDNFDDLTIPPENTYPNQVRSDIKDYLNNMNNGITIGRAQFDYYKTFKPNHHFMISAGILEEMYSGYGFEYLYFQNDRNYAYGFEIFDVVKRDYRMRFGTQSYRNLIGSFNFYYRNYKTIPFDMKLSVGEYIAGDEGVTIELSRSFLNGTKFGVFASFTDVSSDEFGEGSFDKGVFFNIPIFGNFINYTWRPLTKDPGAKLIRKNTLNDLLIKFKPYNY